MKAADAEEVAKLVKQYKALRDFLAAPPAGAITVAAGNQSIAVDLKKDKLIEAVQKEAEAVNARIVDLANKQNGG